MKVYALALGIGLVGLITLIFGGALAAGMDRAESTPGWRSSRTARLVAGGLVGFGMGGLSAEFSPLDLAWPAALGLAAGAAVISVLWVAYASRLAGGEP